MMKRSDAWTQTMSSRWSPMAVKRCGVAGPITTMSPATATTSSPPTTMATRPASTMHVSAYGCRCSPGPFPGARLPTKKEIPAA